MGYYRAGGYHPVTIEDNFYRKGVHWEISVLRGERKETIYKKLPLGIPEYGVLPPWLGEASANLELLDARILLSDFGNPFSPAQEKRFESHTPLLIRSPEARL